MESEKKKDAEPKLSWLAYYSAFAAFLGSMSMGFVFAYTGTAFGDMDRPDSHPRVRNDSPESSLIGSILVAGALIGALFAGPVSGKLGRKLSLLGSNVPFIVGWSCMVLATEVWHLVLGRFATGIAAGFLSGCINNYIVEICPTRIRGKMGLANSIVQALAILLSNVLGAFVTWRTLAAISAIPSICMPLLMLKAPETPVFLMNKYGLSNAVEETLKKLRSNRDTKHELEELRKQKHKDMPIILPIEKLKNPIVYKPLLLSMALFVFQQFSGVTAIGFSAIVIFKKANASIDPNLSVIIVNIPPLILSAVGGMVIDRFGRKALLYLSGTGNAVSLATLGYYFFRSNDSAFTLQYGWLALASLIALQGSLSIGFNTVPWMMMPEMSPFFARSFIGAVATSFNWTLAFTISYIFVDMQKVLTVHGTFWLFSIMSALSVLFVLFFVPETKGKSFLEIQKGFENKKNSMSDESDTERQLSIQCL